ncbi:MAG: hypothetical protein HIU81_10085 [Acidobacteria bacterium]|nr:hypothetical protein [Acidobacteriota bacterium]
MHHTGGPGWRITMDTSGPLMVALYIRDVAGLTNAGIPQVSSAEPGVRAADPRALVSKVGGMDALHEQWEQWWKQLVANHPAMQPELSPPWFGAFSQTPALQRVLQAHFGAALTWARDRQREYYRLAEAREISGAPEILRDLVQDRELELGRHARDFSLTIVELPLSEPRAWYLEPSAILMSQSLLNEPEEFRSYVQPVVELMV